MEFNQNALVKLANMKMPYGKYRGQSLIQLPEPYIAWYQTKGFPKGELGELLGLLYEIKLNGLESLVYPLMEEKRALLVSKWEAVRPDNFS